MAVDPYEADPKKVPQSDPYLSRSPHYGRYAPRPEDFTPRYNSWYESEQESIPYWKEIVEQHCTSENSLKELGSREAFAAGKVIIRIDQEKSDGPAAERYSYLNANELCAARKAEEVLKDLNVAVPVILFYGTIDGKNVTVESRISGVSLEVAWRHLPEKERQNLKLQCRQIIQHLGSADTPPDAASYVCRDLNTVSQPGMQELEREILFAPKGQGEDLCLVHNDMRRSNIIVDNGRIVGILGWRQSGFFGHDRAKRVHRQFRTPESSYLPSSEEESVEEQAWADLYDTLESVDDPTAEKNQEDPTPMVKTEPSATSLDKVPMSQLDGTDAPDEHPTPKKISDLKRGSMSRASSSERSSPTAPSKRGPAGRKSSTASAKKVTPAKKPAPKKRKLDSLDADNVEGQRSNTPSSSGAGKDPSAKKQGSASVAGSPAPDNKKGKKTKKKTAKNAPQDEAAEDDSDVENADEVFCICRKPDNHTWMIGCDGGCEDWFHGKCVNIDPKDADLIDKYICPNCHEAGKGRTTWKPMCRLKECRKPARLTKKNLSKYCSDEHGREFMRRMTQHLNLRTPPSVQLLGPNGRGRGTTKSHLRDSHSVEGDADSNMEDGAATNDEEDDYNEEDLGSRGGVLTVGDLKAAVMGVSSAEEFRRLGDRLVSPPPPPTEPAAGTNGDVQQKSPPSHRMGLDYNPPNLTYSLDEEAKLQKLRKQCDNLLYRRELLRARTQFIGLVRQRAKSVLERLKQKDPKGGWKDICGFDPRLSWNEDELDEWRLSEAGKKAFEEGNLPPPEPVDSTATDADGDHQMADAEDNDNDNDTDQKKDDDFDAFARGVCLKKRCERHKQWVKVHQQDILFEESMLQQDLRKCEREAEAVVERAVLRMWAQKG